MRLPEFSAFSPATLRGARVAATEQSWLDVEPPDGFLDAHVRAGQFCKMRVDDREGIFAMFSAPSERAARFLVRVGNPVGGEAADALSSLTAGAPIEMTLPAGDGFPLERALGRDVRFVATGTGVAPVRAAIEAVLARRDDYGELSLDHGVRTASHLAIGDDIERWRARGLDVRLCFSDVGSDGAMTGTTVQRSLEAHVTDLSDACVVAVGQTEMLLELADVMQRLGGDPSRMLTNI